MENNLKISVSANLDKAKSIAQINKDIKNIEKQIAKLKLKATIDKSELQKQIKALNKQKHELYVSLKVRKNELKAQYKKALQEVQAQPLNVNVSTANAKKQVTELTNTVQTTRSETVTLASALKKSFSNMGLVISAQTALQLVRQAANEAKEAILEYDKYATNLSIITGGSRENSNEIIADLSEKSFEFKTDISELESAYETLLRTGKAAGELDDYLKSTVYLSKTGFESMDTSAENLVTIGNAFELQSNEIENVVSSLLALDTASNTVAGKLSTALAKTAQNGKLAGLSLDELGAIIAGLRDTTGKTEDEIATSLNSITSRLYNVKLGKYELELEDGSIEDISENLNDTERALKNVGISLRSTNGEFKDATQIIDELAPKFDELNNVQQNMVAKTLAGTYHKNTFIALIENWDKINELTQISANSAGQAEAKYSQYIQGIEAKSAALSTSMKEMFNNLIPQSFASDMIDSTTAIVRFTDKYSVLQTAIKSAVFYGLAKGIIATKNSLSGMVSSVRNVSYAMELASKGSSLTSEQFRNLQMVAGTLTDKQLKLILSTNKLTYADKLNIVQTANMTRAEAEQKLATMGITQAQNTATISTFSLSGAFKSLFNIIRLNPVMALTMAFTAVTSVASAYKQKQEELIQSAKQSAEETSEYIDSLEGLKDKYLEIVDSENSMSEKTQELNKFKQELVETYGFEKDIIDKLNLSREHGIELLDEEAQKQAKAKRNEFYAQNDKVIQKSINEFENTHTIVYNGTEGNFNSIPDDIKSMFTKPKNVFSLLGSSHELTFKIDATDIYDEYEKINALIVDLQNKDKLNYGEKGLLSALETSSKNLKKKIDDYGNTYQTYYEYKSQDLLEDYVAQNGDAANLTGKELENWKNNLYATADGNKVLEKSLANLADEYIQLSNAKKEASADDTSSDTENISELDDNVSNLNDKLDEYKEKAKSFSSIQATIKKATEEQNTFGRISADTINALHEAGLDGAMTFNEMTGETYFLVDSVDELTRALIDNQNVEIEKSITDTTTAIKRLKEEIKNLGVIDSADDATKASELYKQLAEKETDLSDLNLQKRINASYRFSFETTSTDNSVKDAFNKEKSDLDYSFNMDMITQEEYYNQLRQLNEKYYKDKAEFLDEYRQYEVEVYKGLKQIQEEQINSVKEAFSNAKTELDHLKDMDAIPQEEYYNKLFELNEKYFKGKTELLDEYRQYEEEVYKGLKQVQIDAIQEQIDALKSVNEEKQEEIDLEKAKQALENAKRNKTISVYDSERGWIRETDRNAIDSAQKEYDDLVLNEKVEVLENLIDAIENGTNTSHNLDESINAVEQVNSITGQQFIENVMQSFANKGLDFNSMFNTNGLTNGADVYNSIMQGKITPVSSDSYTTNNNNTITLNGVTVMANNPEEFIAQMEDIANERFKENFPAAMNQFGRDLKRYQMNHSF